MHRTRLPLLVLLVVVALAAGCGGRRHDTIQASDLPQTTAAPGDAGPAAGPGAAQGAEQGAVAGRTLEDQVALGPTVETPAGPVQEVEALRDVYFDFDSASLGPAARETLAHNASWMERYARASVLIEGHTDQRGSVAYNLALGERRAVAARDYLISLGIGRQRLSTISYGKERPADPGMTEEAYAKNRRAHFVVVTQASGAQQ